MALGADRGEVGHKIGRASQLQTRRATVSTRLALSLTIVFLGALGVLTAFLGRVVLNELDNIGAIATERLTWNLSQVQVEHLQLKELAHLAEDGEGLHVLRLKFNIFYSRVATLRESPMFAELRSDTEASEALDRIQARLDHFLPIVDGSDRGLLYSLPGFILELQDNGHDTRKLVRYGLLAEEHASAVKKRHLSLTLKRLAWVLLVLVMALGLTALMIWRLFHRSQMLSAANSITTARMRAIVTSSLDAILMVDVRGRIMSINEAAQTIFGYTGQEALGRRMVDLIVPDNWQRFMMDNMTNFITAGEGMSDGQGRLQMKAKRKSGEIFPVELSVSASQAGEDMVFVFFLRDITARVEGEAALRRARDDALAGERAKANLLTVLSHEIRTPLNGILGSIELLETTGMLAEEQRYLRAMRISGELLLHHVNEVLEMSRLEAGTTPEQYKVFDLLQMVQGLVDGQQANAQAHDNQLRLRCRLPGQPFCLGNVARIQQALLNLIGNALKFTEGGEISVEVERHSDSDTVEFRVSDTGPGMADTDLDRIFEDFVTLDSSYSRQREGTGLGLAITQRIVENMGGTISVESELGEGSLFTFSLSLPLVSKRQTSPSKKGVDTVIPKRILVVEDNDINRMLLEKMLQRQGHSVDSAIGGAEGVQAVAENRYDMVLMDISMPGVDGIEALSQIRSRKLAEGVEIVALTAHAAGDDHERIMGAGFTEVLTKPVTQAELAKVIDRYTHIAKPLEDVPGDSDIQQFVAALGEERARGYLNDFCQDVARLQHALDTTGRVTGAQQGEAHRLAGSAAVLGLAALRICMLEIEAATPDTPLPIEPLAKAWSEAGVILGPHLEGDRA